jgi:hypothetical protein
LAGDGCSVTMFSLFTSFSARYRTAKEYSINEPALLAVDETVSHW